MTTARNTINVGLINCNRRALWYGTVFGDINPGAYARLDPQGYHYMTYCYNVDLMIPRAKRFRLAKVFDFNRRTAAAFAAAFHKPPELSESIDDVCRGVDLCFIANESGDGSDHLALAAPALDAGIPTFIDRPLAVSVKMAKAIIERARRKRVPLFSCSHMRLLPHAARFKARFAEIPPIETGLVHGHGPNPAYLADAVELALFLFGDEFRGTVESVQSMGAFPLELLLIHFAAPKPCRSLDVLVVNSRANDAHLSFAAKAIASQNPLDSPDFDAFTHCAGGVAVMEALRKMVATGKPPIPYPQLTEPIAVIEAGREAHNASAPVFLKGIR